MNDLRKFEFYPRERRNPYIEQLIEYTISDIEKEGIIQFDGYYYIEDDELPIRSFLMTYLREEKPYKIEGNSNWYRTLEEKFYEIEIYSREKIVNTSSYDEVDEEDGSKMKICYFPTHEQKIKFRIIDILDDYDKLYERAYKYFKEEKYSNQNS